MINIDLLREVCRIPGAPGYEQRIREFIIKTVTPYVDEVKTDSIGNVIAVKKGSSGKKVMVAAHMDEISFIVTDIDNEGFVRFHTLGGFDAKTGRRVVKGTTNLFQG